jgi:hypothetical protein
MSYPTRIYYTDAQKKEMWEPRSARTAMCELASPTKPTGSVLDDYTSSASELSRSRTERFLVEVRGDEQATA